MTHSNRQGYSAVRGCGFSHGPETCVEHGKEAHEPNESLGFEFEANEWLLVFHRVSRGVGLVGIEFHGLV